MNMRADDLLFCISMSGDSRDIIETLETAQQRKIPTITLTSVPKSAAAELSGTVLISAVRRTLQNIGTVAARVPQFVIIEIICAIIALRKKSELEKLGERVRPT
jgi:DNA-binding MurR/RpiR family transcriptional regulator